MKKVAIKEDEQKFKKEKQQSSDSEEAMDETLQLDFVSKFKKKDLMCITYQGIFESAQINFTNSLTLMYSSNVSQNWKLVHGQRTGISQNAFAIAGKLVWNFPFEMTYQLKNPSGWPQIVIVAYGSDYFGRSVAKGYGNFHLPSSAGVHTRKIKMFQTIAPSISSSICSYLMGYINELKQPEKVLLENDGGRQYLQVKSIGQITVKVEVRRHNFQFYGYQ